MSTNKSQEQQEQSRWYISRSYLKLREAINYSRVFKYAESVNSAFESIEFSAKALCLLLDVEYDVEHFIDEITFVKLSEKIGQKWPEKKDQLLSVIPIVLSYSDKLRQIARYGVEDRKTKKVLPVSPDRVFRQDYSDKVLNDAKRLTDLLSQIEKSFKWDINRPIKLGILNGYVRNPAVEKPCSELILPLPNGISWKDYFSELKRDGRQKFVVREIRTNEITEEFAIVLNPYGETYPEFSLDTMEAYNQIKLFIENGGVFFNTAGFAFFYAWNVQSGEKKPISEERVLLPGTFSIKQGTITIGQLQELIRFTGTLFYKDFGASTTYDTEKHSGAHEVKTFQAPEDREKFGVLDMEKINEFRALRKETQNCVPILRANCLEFGEIYPIGSISLGRGFIVVAGISMSKKEEALLFADVINRFCDWMASKYSYTKIS